MCINIYREPLGFLLLLISPSKDDSSIQETAGWRIQALEALSPAGFPLGPWIYSKEYSKGIF